VYTKDDTLCLMITKASLLFYLLGHKTMIKPKRFIEL